MGDVDDAPPLPIFISRSNCYDIRKTHQSLLWKIPWMADIRSNCTCNRRLASADYSKYVPDGNKGS